MNPIRSIITLTFVFLNLSGLLAQDKAPLSSWLPSYTSHFTLENGHQLDGEVRTLLLKELQQHQFVGLAELHRSEQLSYFTTALIELLEEADFKHMALEMGEYQVKEVSEMTEHQLPLTESIRRTNRAYGSRLLQISPLVFADRKEDALFLQSAVNADMHLWGFDQEHLFSFEMQLDALYSALTEKTPLLESQYKKSKAQIRRWNKKQVFSARFQMGCQLQQHEALSAFLTTVSKDENLTDHVKAIRTSLEIYCNSESGKGGNRKRASHMKDRLDELLLACAVDETTPKVFLKFGNVHLTKGKSRFKVDDLGKYVNDLANKHGAGFFNIRHLKRYIKGKDMIGKKGWRSSTSFMKMGKKDEWTLIDLRPLRAALAEGTLECTQYEAFEINSYDMILVSPNDHKARQNF